MLDHGAEIARCCKIPVAPQPSQFHKHKETIEPVATDYGKLYASRRGWPVSRDGIEQFITDDLDIAFYWKDLSDLNHPVVALYLPTERAIVFNEKMTNLADDRPELYVSSLAHELGHAVLRHSLECDCATGSLFDDEPSTPFLNHPDTFQHDMDGELLKRMLKLVPHDAQIASKLRDKVMPDRCEPQWMYDQAQAFAGEFIAPHERLRRHLEAGELMNGWSSIYEVAKRLGCSGSFLAVRLQKLEYIVVDNGKVKLTSGTPAMKMR